MVKVAKFALLELLFSMAWSRHIVEAVGQFLFWCLRLQSLWANIRGKGSSKFPPGEVVAP